MNIKNKLYIGAGSSVVLVVALVSVVLVTSGRIAEEDEKHQLLMDVYESISELDIVTYDYLLHREERMEYQWNIKHDSLGEILAELAEEEGLKSIRAGYAALGNLFSQITANSETVEILIQEGTSQKEIDTATWLEERLVAQLLIISHSIITDASRLAEEAHTEATEAQRVASNLTVILMIVLATAITTSSLIIARSISKPLDELTKGTRIISRGDLEHRVKVKSKDELGEFAVAFNQMTEDLSQDITERRRAEFNLEERLKELTCLFVISELVANPAINLDEILKGIVGLIPDAWQYPEITRARITFDDKEFETDNFKVTEWKQSSDIKVEGKKRGALDVYYLKEKPEIDEGPFLKEERHLIDSLVATIGEVAEHKKTEEDLRKHREHLEELVEERTGELSAVNKELEVFAYSVSHDLRAPLRSIDGFSQALLEDYPDKLDEQGKSYLQRVRSATQRMGVLIDDLLSLSRVTRSEMRRETVDLSALAQSIAEELQETQPERQVDFVIAQGLTTKGDSSLLHQIMENLLGNAWKFTGQHPKARIEFGVTQINGKDTFFVRDDGVGFDMTYADKLFGVFQRLHSQEEFPGTGVGLATVQRIAHRHGGQVWAEGKVKEGAIFYFTLE